MTVSYFHLANQFVQEGNLGEAIAIYRKAIEDHPNVHLYHHNLGKLLVQTGAWEEAIVNYDQCCKINPKSAWYHYDYGIALIEVKQYAKSILAFQEAIALEPNIPEFYKSLGEAFWQAGQPIAIKDIVYKIGEQMGRPDLIQLGAIPAATNDTPLVIADVKRLSDEVGFQPTYNLERGIEETINWWRSDRSQEGK